MNLMRDLDVLMFDFGVTVAADGKTTRGIMDSVDEQMLANGAPVNMVGNNVSLIVRTGALDIDLGSIITADGKQYVVREKLQLDDGMLTKLLCAKG